MQLWLADGDYGPTTGQLWLHDCRGMAILFNCPPM
jgi:hypothetical protein